LERLGHTVRLAANGREALDLLPHASFDLVLLDIQMPGLSGYEVLARIKADPALRHLPVIVLSASDETARVARCIQLGAEDYLPKPFDPVLLQARIGACLEKKRLRDREVSYLRQIQEEQQRSDELLHVILPRDVAAELKATRMVQPRRFDNVAVMFCDIVDFTAWCERHSPEAVLLHLQGVMQAFEQLTAQHALEKIKTIGDAYLATAGMLVPLANPALDAARCGLAMIAAARELPPHWELRIGLHVGPVIAGVVGRSKYQYDVWGDTVNTAARMQQAARPGTLCVNAQTWPLLAPSCQGRPAGVTTVKGKGEQEIFQIEALRTPPA
jgi:class 3 adenylate cyclase